MGMASVLKFFALGLVAVAAGAVTTVLIHYLGFPSAPPLGDVSYTDFISIMLTALGLMMAVLAIFIAVAGVIGWATLENKLKDHSLNYFTQQFAEDGPLRRDLEELFADIAYTGIEGLKQPMPEEGPYTD
jgi:hypothetical protein